MGERRGKDKQPYPPGASECQCVGQRASHNSVFACDFKGGRMRGLSLVTLATSVIHVSYMTRLQTHKCTDTHQHITKSLTTALSVCQRLNSPRSLDEVCVTSSQYPRIPAGCLGTRSSSFPSSSPRWTPGLGGHGMMRRKEWRGGTRPEAYCRDGKISISATVATHTGRVNHTKMCTHTHTQSEKATQTGSSVTSDYPPATLTWRDWGHMNGSVALSDV